MKEEKYYLENYSDYKIVDMYKSEVANITLMGYLNSSIEEYTEHRKLMTELEEELLKRLSKRVIDNT